MDKCSVCDHHRDTQLATHTNLCIIQCLRFNKYVDIDDQCEEFQQTTFKEIIPNCVRSY